MSDIHTLSPFASLPETLPERDENPEALFFPIPLSPYIHLRKIERILDSHDPVEESGNHTIHPLIFFSTFFR